jgi:hypothetical protein
MHGKHSRMIFIPLYRNTVCNNGIDSRKCATGLSGYTEPLKYESNQQDAKIAAKSVTSLRLTWALPLATVGG